MPQNGFVSTQMTLTGFFGARVGHAKNAIFEEYAKFITCFYRAFRPKTRILRGNTLIFSYFRHIQHLTQTGFVGAGNPVCGNMLCTAMTQTGFFSTQMTQTGFLRRSCALKSIFEEYVQFTRFSVR